nr:protein deadpan-like isoform X1 [Cherax quadricarinatus]
MLSVLSMTEGHLEDDGDDNPHILDDDDQHHDTLPLSKAELRKSNKPIMEKRRRARINTCLNELKALILDAMKKDPARHSKLEKADILEMTVKHLQAVQRQQLALAVAHDPAVLTKFRSGFTECAQEVTRYVSRIEGVDTAVRQRLMQHLGQCVSGLTAMTPMSFTAMAGLPMPLAHLQGNTMHPAPPPTLHQNPGDINNNQARLIHGLVAARLAAAGDAAGAALLLHGGLSLLARAAPHAPTATQPTAPSLQGTPTGPSPQNIAQPSQVLQPQVVKINDGASSSGERPLRPSAFTAVRRASSPLRTQHDIHTRAPDTHTSTQTQQVVAPTARRYIGPPETHQETVVRAQVAVQPVNLTMSAPQDADLRAPLDYSFRKRSLTRPTPTHPASLSMTTHTNLSHTEVKHSSSTHLTPSPYPPGLMLANKYQVTQSSHLSQTLTNKRPLEEQDNSCACPPKIMKTEYSSSVGPSIPLRLTPPGQSLDSSQTSPHLTPTSQPQTSPLHLTPPTHSHTSPLHLTPTSHTSSHSQTSPSYPTPPSHTSPSHVAPPSHISPSNMTPPPSLTSLHSHASPETSPTSPTTPKKEMALDNASPDRPSTSATQEEKDMWRPW